MQCLICKSEEFDCIHEGTRDIPDIKVLKCRKCGMVCLDNQKQNAQQNYARGGMLQNSYVAIGDKTEDMSWETWIRETERDDERRFAELNKICKKKDILEFGCGNGGFLRRMRNVAGSVTGIELMDEARERIQKEGIKVYRSLDEVDGKYDVVCTFMVIEHLNDPDQTLKMMHDVLKQGGLLICETPNADDALITKYECKDFEDFTYWSEHVFLFTSDTLEKLLSRNGFQTKWNRQIQRYSLANHLYWLSKGKPGGHMRWIEFNGGQLNAEYAEKLANAGMADTLWYAGSKQ